MQGFPFLNTIEVAAILPENKLLAVIFNSHYSSSVDVPHVLKVPILRYQRYSEVTSAYCFVQLKLMQVLGHSSCLRY